MINARRISLSGVASIALDDSANDLIGTEKVIVYSMLRWARMSRARSQTYNVINRNCLLTTHSLLRFICSFRLLYWSKIKPNKKIVKHLIYNLNVILSRYLLIMLKILITLYIFIAILIYFCFRGLTFSTTPIYWFIPGPANSQLFVICFFFQI